MLANKWRPTTFADVVGQEEEIKVLRRVVTGSWGPNAILFTGPFGTGKTTLARLTARALLCQQRTQSRAEILAGSTEPPFEPCGTCDSCRAMSKENHPNYIETDAASKSSVADVRDMKEEISYRSGDQTKIICYDESHMLSHAAQNAFLITLEEGVKDVLFMFCTTEAGRMLPTLRSRCVELQVRLLTTGQLERRLNQICEGEGINHEGNALRTVATYVRGHARDAIVMTEQLSRIANPVTEDLVRSYLKLDRYTEIYKLLCEEDRKAGLIQLETLLCNFSASELAEALGEVCINAYKLHLGIETFIAVDKAWLKRVIERRDPTDMLDLAEKILTMSTDHASINQALASFGNRLFEPKAVEPSTRTTKPATSGTVIPAQFRKPAKA
jgi:DNA polymerase III subunit gamma/tau